MAKTIIDTLISEWGDSYQEFRAITLVGGGGLELNEKFRKDFPAVLSVKEPQFSNVKGFLYYANLLEKSGAYK